MEVEWVKEYCLPWIIPRFFALNLPVGQIFIVKADNAIFVFWEWGQWINRRSAVWENESVKPREARRLAYHWNLVDTRSINSRWIIFYSNGLGELEAFISLFCWTEKQNAIRAIPLTLVHGNQHSKGCLIKSSIVASKFWRSLAACFHHFFFWVLVRPFPESVQFTDLAKMVWVLLFTITSGKLRFKYVSVQVQGREQDCACMSRAREEWEEWLMKQGTRQVFQS